MAQNAEIIWILKKQEDSKKCASAIYLDHGCQIPQQYKVILLHLLKQRNMTSNRLNDLRALLVDLSMGRMSGGYHHYFPHLLVECDQCTERLRKCQIPGKKPWKVTGMPLSPRSDTQVHSFQLQEDISHSSQKYKEAKRLPD